MRPPALVLALLVTATAAVSADSPTAALRVGVSVSRRCAITSGATPEVRCTRMPGASAAPLVFTSPRQATPLTSTAPGASPSARVVTVLF
jgi:hypothetical protein